MQFFSPCCGRSLWSTLRGSFPKWMTPKATRDYLVQPWTATKLNESGRLWAVYPPCQKSVWSISKFTLFQRIQSVWQDLPSREYQELMAPINSAVSHIAPCSRVPDQPHCNVGGWYGHRWQKWALIFFTKLAFRLSDQHTKMVYKWNIPLQSQLMIYLVIIKYLGQW